nr:HAD-IA family hydrolase [Candidatus Reidiella endopervernicosa]
MVNYSSWLIDSMTMNSYKLLIFDWDGTLMDSVDQILYCMRAAIGDLELEPRTGQQIRDIIGLGLHEAVETLYPGREPEFAQVMADRYRHHFLSADVTVADLFDDVDILLEQLRSSGYLLAVATGKGRTGLDKVLNETGMGAHFHTTRCSDETRSKPHPLMLEQIMNELDCLPEQTLMIGDSEFDLDMANRAGVGSVGVSHGVHSCDRLVSHNPLGCLDRVADLHSWLSDELSKSA